MNSQSTKQLNLRPIYAVVAIGFALLGVLIWWIGMRSSAKLNEISVNARKGTNEYMDRLRLALNIQEAATEVVAESRVYRARQGMRVPIPPFAAKLKSAKKRFYDQIEEGKKQWSSLKEHETLTEEEMGAWREVEKASQKFLDNLTQIENSPNEEDSTNGPEPDQPSEQAQNEQTQPGKDDFYRLRNNLDTAAKKLTDAVTRVRNEILDRIVNQQETAASEVNQTTWITLL